MQQSGLPQPPHLVRDPLGCHYLTSHNRPRSRNERTKLQANNIRTVAAGGRQASIMSVTIATFLGTISDAGLVRYGRGINANNKS